MRWNEADQDPLWADQADRSKRGEFVKSSQVRPSSLQTEPFPEPGSLRDAVEIIEALVERLNDARGFLNTWESWEMDYWVDKRAKALLGEERFAYLTEDGSAERKAAIGVAMQRERTDAD